MKNRYVLCIAGFIAIAAGGQVQSVATAVTTAAPAGARIGDGSLSEMFLRLFERTGELVETFLEPQDFRSEDKEVVRQVIEQMRSLINAALDKRVSIASSHRIAMGALLDFYRNLFNSQAKLKMTSISRNNSLAEKEKAAMRQRITAEASRNVCIAHQVICTVGKVFGIEDPDLYRGLPNTLLNALDAIDDEGDFLTCLATAIKAFSSEVEEEGREYWVLSASTTYAFKRNSAVGLYIWIALLEQGPASCKELLAIEDPTELKSRLEFLAGSGQKQIKMYLSSDKACISVLNRAISCIRDMVGEMRAGNVIRGISGKIGKDVIIMLNKADTLSFIPVPTTAPADVSLTVDGDESKGDDT